MYICTHTYINIYVCMFVCIPYVIVSCSSYTDSFILLSFSSKEIRQISNKLEYRNAAAIDTYTMNNTQFSSVAQSCPTLCDLMNSSTPGSLSITNSRSSLKLMSIESAMPSSHQWTFADKVISLLFNMLSRLVGHNFPSVSFNFMAAITICSDFGAQENKVSHSFHCFPIYFP